MAIKFKLWLHKEQIDEDNDDYRDIGEPEELACEESEEKIDAIWCEVIAHAGEYIP